MIDYFKDVKAMTIEEMMQAEAEEGGYEYYPMDDFEEDDAYEENPIMSLAMAYESSQLSKPVNTYMFKFIPQSDFMTFRLLPAVWCRTLHNGHPVGNLQPGTFVELIYEDVKYVRCVDIVDRDAGTVKFTEYIPVPYIIFNLFAGDLEKMKIYKALQDVELKWNAPNRIVEELFMQKVRPSAPFNDNSQVALIRGVVGSGKSYKLSQDVLKHKPEGYPQIVVAETNSALTSVGEELEARGLSVIQFTHKDTPFSLANVLKQDTTYTDWKFWAGRVPITKHEKELCKVVRRKFFDLLSKYVVLMTPSKAYTYYHASRAKDKQFSIYVDEGGLMTFLRSVQLLLFAVKRFWVYGDYDQQTPWTEHDMVQGTLEQRYLKMRDIMSNIGMQSLAQLVKNMNVPELFISTSRRIPVKDAEAVVPFFYDNASNVQQAANWLDKKVPPIKFRISATTWVPPALLKYERMSFFQKNKEASRMNKFLNWLSEEIDIRYLKQELFFELTVISPYIHLIEGLEQMMKKFYIDIVDRCTVNFVTVRKAQGATYQNVVFYVTNSPGMFVDDRQFLVGLSRHKQNLFISDFNVSGMVSLGLLVQMKLLNIVDLVVRPLRFHKTDAKNLAPNHVVKVGNIDWGKMVVFFSTGAYEFYRKIIKLPYCNESERSYFQTFSGIQKYDMDNYMERPERWLGVLGKGYYKYLMLRIKKARWKVEPPDGRSRLSVAGCWTSDVSFSVPIQCGAIKHCKVKQTRQPRKKRTDFSVIKNLRQIRSKKVPDIF